MPVPLSQAIPGTVACGDNQNPASYIMEVIGAGITRVAHREYAIDYKKSELYDVNAEELDTLRWSKGEAGPDFSEEVGHLTEVFLLFASNLAPVLGPKRAVLDPNVQRRLLIAKPHALPKQQMYSNRASFSNGQ